MSDLISVLQLVVSLFLIVLILLQGRGAGLGKSFGGMGEFYRTRRGFERILFIFTIILVILFFLISLVNLVIS